MVSVLLSEETRVSCPWYQTTNYLIPIRWLFFGLFVPVQSCSPGSLQDFVYVAVMDGRWEVVDVVIQSCEGVQNLF